MKKPATRPALTAFAAVLALAALGSPAHADPAATERGVSIALHLTTGGEILGNADVTSSAWRSYLGMDAVLGRGRGLRPTLGLGGTLARGSFQIPDARALGDMLSINYFEVGPEVRLGLRWVDGGIVDTNLFASFAYVHTDADKRLAIDPVGGVIPGRWGLRAALGVNWAQQIGRIAGRSTGRKDDASWLIVLLPEQLELAWERSLGSDRYGVVISYGI